MDSIDFVLLWVDGNDPNWQNEMKRYASTHKGEKQEMLFRDWDLLRYLFRAFEVFTPWVRRIHFVTWGHVPEWLNTEHPKLHIVKHEDYIDQKYLPVFSSHPLEINLHKISGLSERFVYFNDDTFIVQPLPPERFFKNNLPCDQLISNALSSSQGVGHFVLNDLEILNRHFTKKEVITKNLSKWFHVCYGKDVLRNMALSPWPRFTGFIDTHQPQPFLKATFEEVWRNEEAALKTTLQSKFRSCTDHNQYLFRYWQLAQGKFNPISMNDTAYEEIIMDNVYSGKIKHLITSRDVAMVCLNDSAKIDTEEKFQTAQKNLHAYFETILPKKSSYER